MAPHSVRFASSSIAGLLPLHIAQRRGAESLDASLKSVEDVLNRHDDDKRKLWLYMKLHSQYRQVVECE